MYIFLITWYFTSSRLGWLPKYEIVSFASEIAFRPNSLLKFWPAIFDLQPFFSQLQESR